MATSTTTHVHLDDDNPPPVSALYVEATGNFVVKIGEYPASVSLAGSPGLLAHTLRQALMNLDLEQAAVADGERAARADAYYDTNGG